MTLTFRSRVESAVAARGRLCVGIDPHGALLDQWGLPRSGSGLREFGRICAESFAGDVAVVKPQVAFFEAFGAAGFAALQDTIAWCRQAGALVIADAKRGDIGSTMDGYAAAWLGDGPLASDAMTVSPYLGFGTLEPALSASRAGGRGVFVLARTSNPESAQMQIPAGQLVVDHCAAANRDGAGVAGIVVGATRDHGLDLSELGGPILAPGLGAQGATAADLPAIFGGATALLLPSTSRAVLATGPDPARLRVAALAARDEVERALGG